MKVHKAVLACTMTGVGVKEGGKDRIIDADEAVQCRVSADGRGQWWKNIQTQGSGEMASKSQI